MKRTGRDSPLVTWLEVSDCEGPSEAPSWNKSYRSFGTNNQSAAFWIGAGRVKPNPHFLFPVNAPRIVWRAEVEYKIIPNNEDSLGGNRSHPHSSLAHPLPHRC